MKNTLLFLFLCVGNSLSAAEPAAPLAGAPAEITQFYHDVNFAACFSTQEERKLVSHMIHTHATEKLPKRLQTVATAVLRIREASTFIDPQMVRSAGSWEATNEELTEATSVQRDGKRLLVEVSIHSISPETRSWLVAQYETAASEAVPAPSRMPGTAKQSSRKEIHTWAQEHGRWVRGEAGIVLLKLGK